MSDTVSKQITKECSKIFPLENVLIKKVKVLKKPKFDLLWNTTTKIAASAHQVNSVEQ